MTKPNLVVPQVNSNGSSRQALTDNLCEAYKAGLVFAEKIQLCSPHGRDYQTTPQGTLQAAIEQHQGRQAAVQSVILDIKRMALLISQQGK